MQKYYLIGSPISHSLSPKMHNLAFRLTGIDATYGLCEADETLLVKAVDRLVAEGASGFNVTMPDKTAMCDLCDELSDAARIGRSVNTVKVENGRLIGDTTDGRGFLMAADKAGFAVTGQNITLLGTGGAASAILIDSALSGAKHIFVFYNRESSSVRVREGEHLLRREEAAVFAVELVFLDIICIACLYTNKRVLKVCMAGGHICGYIPYLFIKQVEALHCCIDHHTALAALAQVLKQRLRNCILAA